jgi:hypothetical protein
VSNNSLYQYLAEHCRTHAVRRYLEIGTRDGGSLRIVLENAGPDLMSVCVADQWGTAYGGSGRGGHAHVDQLLDDFNFSGERVFLDGNSRETIPALMPAKADAFDLVLVDGDHSADGGLADLENVWPLVMPGGCLVFHDITHPEHLYLSDVFAGFVATHRAPHRMILEPYGVGVAWRK